MRAAWLAGVALLAASTASANSRLPGANQLVVAPDDPTKMVLRTTFGLLFTRDAGATWDWLCESAIPCGGQQDPAITILNGGVVLSGQVEGLASSPDLGCSWSFVAGTAKVPVIDVTRTRDGTTGLAIENLYTQATDAGVMLFNTTVLRTVNAGQSWQPLTGALDPTLTIDTLDVAPSDTQRIYVTGQAFGQPSATILVSKDGGQSYAPYSIALITNELGAFIAGVDPNVADTVYVRTLALDVATDVETSRLLVSVDGGQTFVVRWSGNKILGFALSADGSRVYVGTATGLLVASTADFAFTQTSSLQIGCLTMSGTTLYVCGDQANAGFIVGSTTNEGATMTPLLQLDGIQGPLTCPSRTSATTSKAQWPALATQLGIDAGTSPPPPSPRTSSCGCELVRTPREREALGWLGAALALCVRRLRR